MTDDLPDEAAALFREAPGSFVAAREALVQQLRAEGRDADASAVKAVRKPTGGVWALNQLTDRDAEGVRALMDAGAELRAAQQAAASSSRGAADRMRDATVARRAVVSRLADVAAGALEELGRGATQLDVISAALEVASIDADAGRRLEAGTLEAVPSTPAGFADVFGLTLVPDEGGGGSGARGAKARGGDDSGRGGDADTAAGLKAEVARLRRDRDAAARKASKARETADRLARELEDARQRIETVAEKHAAADAGAGEAELEAKRAERELARATDRLQKATD